MLIVLDRIDPSGYARALAGGLSTVFASEPSDERRTDGGDWSSSTSSTSSIGRNSNEEETAPDGEEDCKEDEAHSAYRGPLDMMESLEEILPIRRGISNFYNGKSKSFTSLAEASSASSSIRDIAKPEDAYSRRRRNLMASSKHFLEKNRYAKAISKKPLSQSKSSLALAMVMSGSELSSGCTIEDSCSSANSQSSPPLHRLFW